MRAERARARTRRRRVTTKARGGLTNASTCASDDAQFENYDRRSRAMPQLRYELLENLSEKKLALEKKIEAANAPRELARRQMLKEIMSKPRRG